MSDAPDKFFPRSPEYWQKRAKEAQAVADEVSDPEAKSPMLQVVEMYETLAESMAVRKVRGGRHGSA